MDEIMPYVVFLLDYYDPHSVIFPETGPGALRERSETAGRIFQALRREVAKRGGRVHTISHADIKRWLLTPDGASPRNQREINREVLRRYPELAAVVPRPRSKPWHEEQYFTSLFNAVAMYMAFERMPSHNERHRSVKG